MVDFSVEEVEDLIRKAKLEEALKIIINYEKSPSLTGQERLSALILRGRILSYTNLQKSYEIGEIAYLQSKELGDEGNRIEALLIKLFSLFSFQDIDSISDFVSEAETLLSSISDNLILDLVRLRARINFFKAWIHFFKGDYNNAETLALEFLRLTKKSGYELDIAQAFILLTSVYNLKGELDSALNYALKCLKLNEELNFENGMGRALVSVGSVYTLKGDYDNALKNFNRISSMEKPSAETSLQFYMMMGSIHREKGELDQSIKNFSSAIVLAKERGLLRQLSHHQMYIATIYRMKGEYLKTEDYLEQSLALSQKIKYHMVIMWSLFWLAIIYTDEGLTEKARKYVDLLKDLDDNSGSALLTHVHYFARANMEKMVGTEKNRSKAKKFLKHIIGDTMSYIVIYIRSLLLLCELLLEDLNRSNDFELLEEINNLINQSLIVAKKENSNLWLTEITLLQAKLALIQISIPEAKQLLTQAQRFAELNGLTLLAQKISSEHDRLLKQLEMWENLKNMNAPISDRMELAGIDGDIDRVQGKHVISPPELINEEPILLLIMDTSGSTYFNHPFVANWDYSDLFSSFMSAFNTFSSEIFSKSIDRIRIGENTILIKQAKPFLACYVIKGQSYPALQKLTRFTETIRENSEIWQALNKSVKTSEMLEPDKPPALKTVIDEIFTP